MTVMIQIFMQDAQFTIYLDVGMDPMTYFLAFARLAPVQCVTWGHPVTTGVPNMDYFISSDLLEPLPGQGSFRSSSHWSYRTYWRKGEFQIAAPSRGILFVAVGIPAGDDPSGAHPADAEALLRRLHSPEAQHRWIQLISGLHPKPG